MSARDGAECSSAGLAQFINERHRLARRHRDNLVKWAPQYLATRWLDELLADANANAQSIAKHERCSIRKVNMTISLAFLAPDLVKAAIAGRLPHGMGVARLADMPAEWSRQHQMLGLPSA
jgi:hypothetical protein